MEFIIISLAFSVLLSMYTIKVIKKSVKVWDELKTIEIKIMACETVPQLDKISDELNNIYPYHHAHHAEIKRLHTIVKIKMQYINQK